MSINTPFGPLVPQEEDEIIRYLLADDNGYMTGPTFFNRIGLSTWLPAKLHIASNRFSEKANDYHIEVHKPDIEITGDNKKYLQILDCIRDLDVYPVDAPDPHGVIHRFIEENALDKDILGKMQREKDGRTE